MATRGAPGKLFEIVGEAGRENTRLGQAFVLFGLLSIVGGVGLFVLTETFRFDPDAFLTYRRAAAGLAGYGLPAFLYGLVVVAGGNSRAAEVGVVGVLLSGLAVFAFFLAYPTQWDLATSPTYVVGTLAAYGLGVMLSSFAAGGAMLARLDADDADDETGFVWGDPPES
jgi:hypothetical protein